jgi:hypothetical protein
MYRTTDSCPFWVAMNKGVRDTLKICLVDVSTELLYHVPYNRLMSLLGCNTQCRTAIFISLINVDTELFD